MRARVAFLLILAFWLTMNVLLWRAEYGTRDASASTVPVEVVWRKMLTAPDSSPLRILQHGRNLGFCHWITSVSEDLARVGADAPPEGMVQRVSGYRAQLEGSVAFEGLPGRLRFDGALTLNADNTWRDFEARLSLRPTVWEIRSRAAEQALVLKVEDDGGVFERRFAFADLQNPDAVLRELTDPITYALLNTMGLSARSLKVKTVSSGLRWTARDDWMPFGHSRVRVYRLEARWLERYQVAAIISRVGEVLRLELPDGLVLENDRLTSL